MPRIVSNAHLGESALLRLVVGELSLAERDAAEPHLRACNTCREGFRASERIDAALRAAGPALYVEGDEAMKLPATDPFARRPKLRIGLRTAGSEAGPLAEAAVRAVPEAREMASRLGAALEDDGSRDAALTTLDLDAIRDRLALAYALDGALARVEQDAPRLGRSAAAVLGRISKEGHRPTARDAERAMPLSDLSGRALLLSGTTSLFSGDFEGAEARLQAAWRAFGEGRASEPLLARTEVLEALRRVANGRWAEAEALAARAGETFALTGAEADDSLATLASGLAAWGDGRNCAALTLLRKAALGFGRAEAWGGFSTAACAAALFLAAEGRVAESRRAFRDLRRRKAHRAPLAERMFVRETERIALLLVREPGKKKGSTFRFSAGDIFLLRAASALADGIVSAARESDEKLDDTLRALYGNPSRGFAFLYACQKAALLVAQDPLCALDLSRRVFEEAQSLIDPTPDTRLATHLPREIVQAEAKLLESQAQNQLGYGKKAHAAAAKARQYLRASGDPGFGCALADYYEGSADIFARDYLSGERLLKKALKAFDEYGLDSLVGRSEASLGTLYVHRGDNTRALPYFEGAIEKISPVEDPRPLTITLNNRGNALARLGRFVEAHASYARALTLARSLGSTAHIHAIRTALAHVEFRRGRYARALEAFNDLRESARAAHWESEVIFSTLFSAECMGCLGRDDEMMETIASLRVELKAGPFASAPAMEELFACMDQASIDFDLVVHVRKFLEDGEKGAARPYRRLKIVG